MNAYFQVNIQELSTDLECKFIKSSSKSKALIQYPMGCPRRHCTPDLFISSHLHFMDLADPCGNPSWSSQSFMHHHILCDLFHGIHGVQEMQVSVMMTYNIQLVHTLLSLCSSWDYMATMTMAKGMLHNHNQYTVLLMIHSGIHTQSRWNVLEHYFAEMTPVT